MNASVRPKRVAFVIAHLGPGGAQRVVCTAANALAARGIEVHVITLLDDHEDAYGLEPRVRRHGWALRNGSWEEAPAGGKTPPQARVTSKWDAEKSGSFAAAFTLLRRPLRAVALSVALARRTHWLRRTLRTIEPHTVLSFLTQTNILMLLATRGLPVRTVVSERNDPRLQNQLRRVGILRKLVYPWSNLVTANSHGTLSALEAFVPKEKLAFLPNPLNAAGSGDAIAFAAPTFITVTRLVPQKGLDVLLKAAALAFATLPEWRLAVIGNGSLRDELQALAGELGIASRVDWLGYVDDPMPYLQAAKVFVLTSRFEGSPNALLEAMSCGLPSIVSDASPGPLELVGAEAGGLIVPVEDVEATAAALVSLANDEELRARLGAAGRERTSRHELDIAMRVWLELLDCA